MFSFNIINESKTTRARTGIIKTVHGDIETPIFMPVGTLATVKSLTPEELLNCGAQIILGNTYHLYLRPGCDIIALFNGVHRFMNWDRPLLTDSGGFQVFSLAKLAKITEEGYAFQSHIDGSGHMLTPEKSIDIQRILGSDIVMCLDQCIAHPSEKKIVEAALQRTSRWAQRCLKAWQAAGNDSALFGIVQGGMYKELRERSIDNLGEMAFPGYAVGGLSVGEPKEIMLEIASIAIPKLPKKAPRYVMGVGTPEDIVELVALGTDMFDCVLPTRNARNGQLFTNGGTINICNSRYRYDTNPVEAGCECYTCRHYTRAYLRHLYMAKELLAYRLNTIHNLYYYLDLMKQVRTAINKGIYDDFKQEFYAKRG
jgi:queuine tRNA-ribosyltransferase